MKAIQNPELGTMSTLKMGGKARMAYFPQDFRDLENLARMWPELGPEVLIVGRGSNILFRDGVRDLVLVGWQGKEPPAMVKEERDSVLIMADAGSSLPGLIRWCAVHGFSGLEGLAGIPGKVGGAVAMNAGSYGTEICTMLEKVTVWSPSHGVADLEKDAFSHGYRNFRPNRAETGFIILKVWLRLGRDEAGVIKERIREYYSRKKKSQPVLQNTAGCVFKNPAGHDPAGMLLERIGFRGKIRGKVCFSRLHANFLVNAGQGRSQDALDLIQEAKTKVKQVYGVDLEMEIKVI
ncbi:UDP-N-acetylmuramate dehydrogenase [Desulfonatronovibrio hydrogenovorans]|uniref:UDP-N-acetylmuramate dehydrogenase n=1 Tax=Desulfonatronovibrio hydrogenovorans TaxID=53245 RepID=UPI00048ADC40|nr:UDP-N-acetylmuramate dehydrogenase [Desulfonatronovibrio hydrogenovorans]